MASSHNRPHGITADRLEEGRGTRTWNDKYKTNPNSKFYVSTIFFAIGILQIHFRVFWIFSPCWCDSNYRCFRGTSWYLLDGQNHRQKFQKTYVYEYSRMSVVTTCDQKRQGTPLKYWQFLPVQ
jgi:hypothetical protein